MVMLTDDFGRSALMTAFAAQTCGRPGSRNFGRMLVWFTPLMWTAAYGRVDAMRLLLEHPSANPAAMLVHTDGNGETVIMTAAGRGHVEALRLLLDNPSADLPAASLATRKEIGPWMRDNSALTLAAGFAVGQSQLTFLLASDDPSCEALLLLLRRVPVDRHSRKLRAHMTEVMEVLFQEDDLEWDEPVDLCGVDQPNNARGECVRLLLEHGADGYDPNSPAMERIISERAALARAL
ncbi:hypothetical protein FOA52_012390 [Chlamydomonas sp. UWO 241]|nr:hypothetical protein FOA52_012390 [Chlamydomonas sp. UWO 241]